MNDTGVLGGALLSLAGVVTIAGCVLRRHHGGSGALAFLSDSSEQSAVVETGGGKGFDESLEPLIERLIRPTAQRLVGRIQALYPSSHLDRIHEKLLYGGLSARLRAEEFATIQVLTGVGGVGVALLLLLGGGGIALRFVGALLVAAVALMGPRAWLSRRVEARKGSIAHDLPDMLDLLTISVEAGLGLEAAMETAAKDTATPLGEEFLRTLQEMSLGLSRHRALENLKNRNACEDLHTFVLVLTQADALGMPIGRVLRTQADEMRDRRRARAREQAAKLPVKILFPLMAFILPPLMIVVLGPAVQNIMKMFKQL